MPQASTSVDAILNDSARSDSTTIMESKQDVPALFNTEIANIGSIESIDKAQGNPDWIIFIILLSLAALIVVRIFFSKVFDVIKSNILRPVISRSVLREENAQSRQASFILSIIFYLSGGLFLYLLGEHFSWTSKLINTGFIRYLIFTLLLAVVFPLKILTIRTLGFIFDRLPLAETYIYNIQLTNNALGLILIPANSILAYMNWHYMNYLILMFLAIVAGFLLLQLIKGILIWANQRPFSLHYLILYLCTLEIAPLLVIGRLTSI